MDETEIITSLLAERLEMGIMLATQENVDLRPGDARWLAEWLVGECDRARIGLELLAT